MKNTIKIILVCAPLMLAGCGAKKAALADNGTAATSKVTATTEAARKLAFVQKVSDQKVYAKDIVSNLSFTATMNGNDITVPGSLHMRRDQVIRLQLFVPLLGTEVGRLEFTPDYVLVIDRLHKEYVKGDYNQIDFLKDNGLNFYSLQALFWNQLLLPGTTRVTEGDLSKFDVSLDETGQNLPVKIKNGNLSFVWKANRDNGRIGETDVTYRSNSHGSSTLTWKYANFKALGSKQFPALQEFSFSTNATGQTKKATVKLDMSELKTNNDWDAQTTVSTKYKKVEAQDVLGKLLKM